MIPYQPKVQPIIANTSKVHTSKPLTLKQQRTIEAIPKVTNLSSAMRIGGYSENSISGNSVRQKLKAHIPSWEPEAIKADIDRVQGKCEAKEDYTNTLRAVELKTKVAGLITIKTDNKTTITDERRAEIDSLFEQWFTPNNTPVTDKLT